MIKIAIVGTGGMAHMHARNYQKLKGVKLVAGCDVNPENVKNFCKKFGIKGIYTDINEMLSKEEIDGVSNATPDQYHKETSIAVMKKGIHILCEKPLALNYKDAKKMVDVAKQKKVINMVNLSYRDSFAIHKAQELFQNGTIGKLKHFNASYLQSWLVSNQWGDWRTADTWLWRLSKDHGSNGVLGDVGVHIIDFLTFPAGNIKSLHCQLKTFDKAKNNKIKKYKLDANDSCIISAELQNGAVGTITATRFATGHINDVSVVLYGDKGAIKVDLANSYNTIQVCLGKDINPGNWKTIKCKKTPSNYQRFINSIKTGKNDQPNFQTAAVVQKAIDACFVSDKQNKTIKV
ncbi:MAG: oxidoreductase [Planctomycetota bacterium]|nr:MAG: oxidoreductase [Planctomycetota bacterium]